MVKANDFKSVDKKPPIVCFAGSDWWYHNRGLYVAQIMPRLAKHNKVLFINSLGMRVPSIKTDRFALHKIFRKIYSFAHFLRKDHQSGMYVMSPVTLPLWGNKLGRLFNTYSILLQLKLAMFFLRINDPVYYIGCPPALEIVKKLGQKRFMIYERTDLFEEMQGVDKPYIHYLDEELVRLSDLVLYVDVIMYNEGVKKKPNSLLTGHGVDYSLFAHADKSDYVPADIANIPRPIIGYYGDIFEEVFDFDLLEYLATSMPDMSFVLIGPLSSNVDRLKKYKNIYLLGQKPYEEIPHYAKAFNVSILPRKKNEWVLHSYPVKIKEYLALGNPFVSVDIPAVRQFSDVIYIAGDYDEFVSHILSTVKENDLAKKIIRRERVRNETWDNKVKQIESFIAERLQKRGETNIKGSAH
jgi:hypothetical protein